MESPFKDNFDDARDEKSIEVRDPRTKEEINEDLFQKKKLSNRKISNSLILLFFSCYLLGRSQLPMSVILIAIKLNWILLFCAIITILISSIVYFTYSCKNLIEGISYSRNERSIKSIFSYNFYFPEREYTPISALFKSIKYILITELAISSFFIIDYLFDL